MKKYHIDLTKEERVNLSSIIKTRSSKSSVFKRACVLLASDRNGELNYTDKEISFHYHVSIRMIKGFPIKNHKPQFTLWANLYQP